jgi:hypothetical protein
VSAAAPTRRDVRHLITGAAGSLSGKRRGSDPKVRRESYDVDAREAQVFSRIADGSVAGGRGWIDDLVALAEEYDLTQRKPGQRAPLGAQAVRILKVMLQRGLRFHTGQLDPAVRTISTWTGYTYKTVHAALTRLKAHSFLDWVRRTRRTEAAEDREAGPQREQVSNGYHFASFARWPSAVLQRWKYLRERRRRRLAARSDALVVAAPSPALALARPRPADPALAAVLDALEAQVESANPTRGESTCSGVKG